MKVISVNVGLPGEVEWQGKRVATGIFKTPVSGAVNVSTLNLEGDGQADLSVHGGPTKAVYVYPSEHYEFWQTELPGTLLPWGMFGENLSTQGLTEADVEIGDEFRIGTVRVQATEPRMPCYKLGIRFGRTDIVKRFLQSGRMGLLSRRRAGGPGAGRRLNRAPQGLRSGRHYCRHRASVHDRPRGCRSFAPSGRTRWAR